MWFHEPIRADDWVVVDLKPLKARSARGTYHGSLRDRHGLLGAILCQEHLLLPLPDGKTIEE
jgi:acyl-CoA thioesterase-2